VNLRLSEQVRLQPVASDRQAAGDRKTSESSAGAEARWREFNEGNSRLLSRV